MARLRKPARSAGSASSITRPASSRRRTNAPRYVRRRILDRFCAHKSGGDKPYRLLERRHITRRRAEMTNTPEGGNNIVKSLRVVFRWAMQEHVGLADRNPAEKIPYLRGKEGGFHSWTPEEVEQFEKRHPLGTKARLALALLLCTGARRSDLVRLGRQMVRDGWIT